MQLFYWLSDISFWATLKMEFSNWLSHISFWARLKMDSLSNKGDWMDERWWKVVEWMKMGEVERKWEKKYIARRLTCSGEIKDRIESFLKYFWRPRKPKLTIQVRLQQLMYSQFHLLRWHDDSLKESFPKLEGKPSKIKFHK